MSPALAEKDVDDSGQIVAAYAWVPTIKGTTSLGAITVPVRVTPKDFAQGFKGGGMGYVQARDHDRFVYAEIIFVDQDDPAFRPFFNQPVVSQLLFVEAGAGLRRRVKLADGRRLTLSPYAGIQHLSLNSRVDGAALSVGARGKWTNPALGIIMELPLSSRLGMVAKIDAAGFGLGRTDYKSGALALQYRISRHVALDMGYRHAAGEFRSERGLALDLGGGGPLLALRFDLNL